MKQEQDMKIYIPQTHGSAHPPADAAPETDERVAIWEPSVRSGALRQDAPH